MFSNAAAGLFTRTFQAFAFFLLAGVTAIVCIYTLLSAFGVVPWLSADLTFGDLSVYDGGMALQIALSVFLVALMFFVPSSLRVMALERSHRHFRMSMDDVARAYHQVHAADRAGLFTMSSEFDAIRERIEHLRDHPDMVEMETDILTVAAQMGRQSRHLADIYSDEKVARARSFLRERQSEADRQQRQIVEALHICREIRNWAEQVEAEEAVVASQLAQLDDQLQRVLPALGYGFEAEETEDDSNIVQMPTKPAAE